VAVGAGGPRLAVREFEGQGGHGHPFLLVHGLASNARLWDGVARRLAAAGLLALESSLESLEPSLGPALETGEEGAR
jgi:pimeloyl-ACP methyl ester carboxylesterase